MHVEMNCIWIVTLAQRSMLSLRTMAMNWTEKNSTVWLMKAFTIHLSVSIRANSIKIHCKHNNTKYNIQLHFTHTCTLARSNTNPTMARLRTKKDNYKKNNVWFGLFYTEQWWGTKNYGTTTKRWLNASHSDSILNMKYWRIYVNDIECRNKRSLNDLNLCKWISFGQCSQFHLHGQYCGMNSSLLSLPRIFSQCPICMDFNAVYFEIFSNHICL